MKGKIDGVALRVPTPDVSVVMLSATVQKKTTVAEVNAAFCAAAEGALSDLGRWWIGGLLEHLPALLALTCPSMNSYQRLSPSGHCDSRISSWNVSRSRLLQTAL